MPFADDVRPLLAARAATDPAAARLLEMFTKADESLTDPALARIGDVEIPKLVSTSGTNGNRTGRAGSTSRP